MGTNMSLFLILTKEMLLHTANKGGGIIKYPLLLDYPNLSIVLVYRFIPHTRRCMCINKYIIV